MINKPLKRSLVALNKKVMKTCLIGSFGISGHKMGKVPALSVDDLRAQGDSPTPLEAMYLSEAEKYIVDVPVSLIVKTRLMDAWVNTIRMYKKHGKEAAQNCLATYFDTYQPSSVAEFLGILPSKPWHHDDPLSYVYPWDMHDPKETRQSRITTMCKEAQDNGLTTWKEEDGWKGFGPASRSVVELETHRLLAIFDSIRNEGLSERYGYIVGRIFVFRDVQIIQPRRGWHRVAVCLAMGVDKIPMMFHKKYAVVRLEDAQLWPNVKRGHFALHEAVDIFNRRFREHMSQGDEISRTAGYVSDP